MSGPTLAKAANPIAVACIDHVVIRVDNLEEMIAFYTTVVGCTLVGEPGDMRLAQLSAGSSLLDLVDASGPIGKEGGNPPDRNAQNMDHVCLQLETWDTDAITAHLEDHDVGAGEVLTRYGAGGYAPSMYIRDPEGNNIELKGPSTNKHPG